MEVEANEDSKMEFRLDGESLSEMINQLDKDIENGKANLK